MPSIPGIAGNVKDTAGIVKQLVDLGSSLINPSKVKRLVGKVARPIKYLPDDVKDPNKTKAENKDKRESTFLEKVFARVTYLHVIGVLCLIGTLLKPLIDRVKPVEEEGPGFISGILDKVFNAGVGIGALIVSEISFLNKWHVSERERLEQLGVLEKVTETHKWQELEVEKHLKAGTFPMDVDASTRLLLEVRSSPKHNRATCYEGTHGQGKTLAAYICSYKRVEQSKEQGKGDIEALQIDATKLLEVAGEKIAQTAQMIGMLGRRVRDFVSEDPLTYANEEIERELARGSVVVNDDAEYQLKAIDEQGFQWLKRIADENGGSFIITIPKSLKDVLSDNKNLQPSDIKTLLQRIDSISFPFENNRQSFDRLDEGLQVVVDADVKESYRKNDNNAGDEEFHQCYLRGQQKAQWRGFIERKLLDGGENFGRESGIGKIIAEYFTDEKIDELISKYPMNPRYIGITIDSLAILLDNRRNKGVARKELDFMLETILECDTFKNYVRSIDYRPSQSSQRYQVTNNSVAVFSAFKNYLKRNLQAGFKSLEGKEFIKAIELIVSVLTASGINVEKYSPKQVHVGSSCLSKRDASIDLQKLELFYVPDLEISGASDGSASFRIVFATDPENPNKLYRGYIQEGRETDVLTLTSVCNEGNKFDAVKKWILESI